MTRYAVAKIILTTVVRKLAKGAVQITEQEKKRWKLEEKLRYMQGGLSFSRLYTSILVQCMENGEGLPCPAEPVVFSSRREAEVPRGSRVRSEHSGLGFLGCHVAGSQIGTLLEAFSSDAVG